MSDVVGLAFRDDRVDAVVVRRRLGQARVIAAFSLNTEEELGAALRAGLHEARVRTRRAQVALPRRMTVVKPIELPVVAGADLRRMVGFELERHLPFPAADAVFDFQVLEQTPGKPARVLLVAMDKRVLDRVTKVLADAALQLRLADVAVHGVAMLAASGRDGPPDRARAVFHLEDAEAELAVIHQGRVLTSRAFPLPPNGPERGQTLARELGRSLGAAGLPGNEPVAGVILTGPGRPPDAGWTELPVEGAVTLPGVSDPAQAGTISAAALAVALRRPGHGPLGTNLAPEELRPRPFPWPLAATGALAGLALLLGLAIPAVSVIREARRLAELERAIARLAPEVRRVEALAASVERARREAQLLAGFARQHVPPLEVLKDVTELLPADAWLTNLSADRKGVELTGFAATASDLIPILEGSQKLEAVEFTSPVTKGRDKEQFRLKASWEPSVAWAAPRPPPATAPPARSGARTPAAPPARRR